MEPGVSDYKLDRGLVEPGVSDYELDRGVALATCLSW